MVSKTFKFDGPGETVFEIDLSQLNDLRGLQWSIGTQFDVVQPQGLSFHVQDGSNLDWDDILATDSEILVKVDGHALREVSGPPGLPIVGNYFEVFPDHLGNTRRLLEKYHGIFRINNMGNINYFTNDPELIPIVFAESEYFSKEITSSHPLYAIKNPPAGVFLADTKDPSWKLVHRFLPPALGPKAVRHYAPTMNACLDEALPIWDELEENGSAWNAYQYMLKVSSGTVTKIMLGKDVHHFKAIDTPIDDLVSAIAESLVLSKKLSSHGAWYGQLPFGDPKRARDLQKEITNQIQNSIDNAKSNGTEDLPMQDAALKAANVIDYLVRATDSAGTHLPKENLVGATTVAAGAGFTTTSSLLSWALYAFVTYEGIQARLLQELVDNDITDSTNITADQIDELPVLDKFVKELQRLHNPSYQPARTAQKDMILPGGYRLAKGAVVIPAIRHAHINPAIWSNPDKFDIDRWDTDEVKNRPKGAYFPFAMGPRMCIGFNFALLEVKIFICKLIYRYHWDKEGESDTEYDPFFQLVRPVNLYVRTRKRETYPSKSSSMQ